MGGALWFIVPLCIDITVKHEGGQKQVQVIGYANAFGSPYLVFWTILLAVVYSTSQLPGQLILSFATIALLAYLEVVDSVRDVETMELAFKRAKPSDILLNSSSGGDPTVAGKPKSYDDEAAFKFGDVVPVALLGLHAFYGTGHQSTISSIQWKAAFMLSSTVAYPWSALTVVVNSIGPIFLFAMAAPLVGLWNRAPEATVAWNSTSQTGDDKDQQEQQQELELDTRVKGDSILAMMIYYTALLLGASVSAAILRRHLMVWKARVLLTRLGDQWIVGRQDSARTIELRLIDLVNPKSSLAGLSRRGNSY
jgi:phosphatidylinositol glycan class O